MVPHARRRLPEEHARRRLPEEHARGQERARRFLPDGHTRRRLLRGAACVLAGLAGCTEGRDDPPPTIEPEQYDNPNVERDPDVASLRADGEGPPIWIAPEGGEGTTGPEDAPPRFRTDSQLIASEATASRLRFADVDGVEDARAFVDDTDFDAETLYLEARGVRECYRVELCYVSWAPDDVETQYGSYLRDADVECSADVRESASFLIRIPDALDPDAVNSHGSGWSSSGCHGRRPPRPDETPARPVDAEPVPLPNATATGAEDG